MNYAAEKTETTGSSIYPYLYLSAAILAYVSVYE
jgi:hypothetical protein